MRVDFLIRFFSILLFLNYIFTSMKLKFSSKPITICRLYRNKVQGCRTCSRVALVLFYFALGMIQKTRVSHITNQTQKQNPQRFDHSPFPMLYLSREENEQSHLGRPATWINFDFLLASWLFTEISFIVVLSIYVKEFSRTVRRKCASCSDRSSINA